MQDSSEKSLLLSQSSSLELEELIINLDDDDRDEAERISATGFNIIIAAGSYDFQMISRVLETETESPRD